MKLRVFVCVAAALILAACSRQEPASGPLTFATPEEAVGALGSALETDNVAELRLLFGPEANDVLSSGDEVADRTARQAFLERFRAGHRLVAGGPDDLMLQAGEDDWPLPIPLVKQDGRWHFDGAAGVDELLRQRIGANELRTIDVMYGYVAAQEQYAATGHDGASAGIYARRLRSEPGKHDGLYWEARDGEPESPAGPLLARALSEGYRGGGSAESTPYHGYLFRLLLSQGDAATGGAKDYLVDGKLTRGFALIGHPAEYGVSGIMTFIVNQDGIVWQRDLGEDTGREAAAIQQFNPDSMWTPIPTEE